MIEWIKIDPQSPPEGNVLFYYDDTIWDGWTVDGKDDDGYPLWESSEAHIMNAHGVRYYAKRNTPPKPVL
ncbi:hypothetical protein D3C74_49520 [compost metagenome]